MEVDLSRQLSRIRIHVPQVIRALRQKYTIQESIMAIYAIMYNETTKTSLIDKIVIIVCSALCNCCKSVVPFD